MNRGLLASALTIVIWSWVTIFITILSDDFDVITQNFFRYTAGSLFLLLFTVIFARSRLLEARKNLHSFILPAFIVFFFQIVWVQSIYFTTPVTATLLSKIDVVFTTLFSFFIFKGERKLIASKYFLAGCTMALIGVVGVALGKGAEIETEFNLGVLLLLLRSIMWASYIISIRNLVTKIEPLIAAAWIYFFASLLFLPTVLIFGNINRIAEVPLSTNLILFGSGALCVGLGNGLNFTAVKYLGATIPVTLLLLTPFFTGVLSYFFFDELLTPIQVVSGLLIIFGSWVIIRKALVKGAPAG
jgi:drug/metabolite transporter (DMT)-like permease